MHSSRHSRSSNRREGGLHTPRDQAPSPVWTEFLTHASENITLPQTSFAGGKKARIELKTSRLLVWYSSNWATLASVSWRILNFTFVHEPIDFVT